MMRDSQRDALDNQLAKAILRRDGTKTVRMAGPSAAGGSPSDDRTRDAFINPMTGVGDLIVGTTSGSPDRLGPGTDGQVLVAQADGTLAWQTVTGVGTGGRYRDIMYTLDGVGGFDWVTDADGNPMYELRELE